jgi:hypothetical protein
VEKSSDALCSKDFLPSCPVLLSSSRLNHWRPRGQTAREVLQGTAEGPHAIADAVLPPPAPGLPDTAALAAAGDRRGRLRWCRAGLARGGARGRVWPRGGGGGMRRSTGGRGDPALGLATAAMGDAQHEEEQR